MTSGNTAADVLWKVPTVICPISPERKRSMRWPARLDPGQQVARGVEDLGAERGDLDRARAARTVEQLAADHLLEGRDLLADRRLRIAQASPPPGRTCPPWRRRRRR